MEKCLCQGGLLVNILELSALPQEGLTWAPLFWKKLRIVCVCVFLYSSTLKASSVCKMSKTYLRLRINDFVLSILVDCVIQVPSSPFLKMPYFTSKDENSSRSLTGEKTIWYKLLHEKMIYIDTGYKSAQLIPTSYENGGFHRGGEDFVPQGRNFIKLLARNLFFPQNIFLKQVVLDTYSKNNLWWVLFIAKLQSEHCRLVTFLKEFHHRIFSDKFSNFWNQLFFATFLFMKKQITWKITWKLGKEKLGKGKIFSFFMLSVS